MSDPQVDLDRIERILDSQPEIANARIEARRQQLMYRGATATVMTAAGAVIVVGIVIYWILVLSGVL